MQTVETCPVLLTDDYIYLVNEHCQGGSLELSLSDVLGGVLSERELAP